MDETIVALATPPGNSGVAVIRISGTKAKQILQKLIKEKLKFEPRKMYLKSVYAQNFVDKCLVVFFAYPFSYTGEDVAEVHSHGGYVLAQKIIDQIIDFGARLAGAGEFSKRAFLNGKLSLDQAEGIMDLINAETEMQINSGSNLLQGKLKQNIIKYQEILTDILAEIEAKLDYPEYEYTQAETSNVLKKLDDLKAELKNLLNESSSGLIIKNGIKIAIVGAPNVGKSSLLNALTKSNKAIVTDVAGTTRDVIEAEYEFNGIIFRLYDTAGIHESKDKVEKIGIERAIKTLDDCDIVLRLSDNKNVNEIKTNKPCIDVLNKIDLLKAKDKDEILRLAALAQNDIENNAQDDIENNAQNDSKNNAQNDKKNLQCHTDQTRTTVRVRGTISKNKTENEFKIAISAKTGENVEALKQLIFNLTVKHKIDGNKFYLTNTRHIDCIKTALKQIENAIKIFNTSTFDVVSFELKSAWNTLGEISGSTSNEAIIDKIFSKFCLGK